MTRSSATALGGLMLLALALGVAPAAAQDLFVDSGQNLGAAESTAVALGDLDGDGDPDGFVANSDGASAVWINQGAAQGGVPGVFQDSGQALGASMSNLAQDVALGDLDGDGDLDAFVVRAASGDSNQVWINSGGTQGGTEGVFLLSVQIFGDDLSSAVALGDVDGDDDLDAFVTRSLGRADKVWLNDGSGQFSDSGQTLGSDDGTDVALGDVDGDNDLDAFVTNDGANKVWRNEGGAQMGAAGTFADSGQTLGSLLSLSAALGDVDGDDDLDAFVANSGSDAVWINQGGLQAGAPGTYFTNGQTLGMASGREVALGDVDGDDDLDAFVANAGANAVWINQGGAQAGTAGQFADAGASLGAATTEGVALGDLDGDTDLDAFAANFGGPDKVWLNGTITALNEINPLGWQIEFADVRGDAGRGASLALDSSDLPQITQIRFARRSDGRDYLVLHARWDSVRWLIDVIDRVVDVPVEAVTSLALDGAGRPHVAYAARSMGVNGPQLKYARFDGTQWQIEVVDANEDVGADVSLALDGTGNPRISYSRDPTGGNETLHYAFFDGAMWTTEQVDATALTDVGGFNALALGPGDEPRIAYHVDSDDDLRYARRSGGIWTVETVQTGNADGYVDLVVDGSGVPHISFIADFIQDVRYATKPGAMWQIENVTDLGASTVQSDTALVLDAMGRPHVSYAPNRAVADPNPELEYARRDPAGWTIERIDERGDPGFYNSLALDASGNPRIAYSEQTNGDLRYASFDTRWKTQPVDPDGTGLAPAIDVVDGTLPEIGYHDVPIGQVARARWEDGAWVLDAAAPVASPVTQTSLLRVGATTFVSFYDAGSQRLMFAADPGSGWTVTEIDASADVGRFNRLLIVDENPPQIRIAYWDATNAQVKLAVFSGFDPATAVLTTNTTGPNVSDPASGPLGATVLADGDIGISYYDGANGDLRMATWEAATGTWSDEPVATAGDVGDLNDIATDGTSGLPVIVYHDATAGAIRYAQRDAGGLWQIATAVGNVAAVSALGLELGLDSRLHARIAFIDSADNAVRAAVLRNGTWYLETVATLGGAGDLGLALGHRPHLALTEAGVGLSHVFRTATLDVLSSPYAPPPPFTGDYNPLDGCVAFLGLILGDEPGTKSTGAVPLGPAPSPPLSDEEIFGLLPAYFGQSFGGQHYVGLYLDHGAEMGQLALADMDLLSDSYGMLQNFMPGLEALVSGQGDELLISQDMIDDALSVWQRLAAAGSPALAQTINAELAKYNDLQDFVGLSFDEWFASLKGETIFANGFE